MEADSYAQWLVEYVHLNPVRPRRKGEVIERGRAAELDAYGWSSHREYAGLRRAPGWLCLDWRRYWGETESAARRNYRKRIAGFFAGGTVTSPWVQLRGGLVLGGEQLWERAQRLVAGKEGQDEKLWTKAVELKRLRARVEELVASEPDERIRVWLLVRLARERSAVVGRQFGYRDGAGVAYVLRRVEAEAQENSQLAKKLQEAKQAIYSLQS